MAETEYDAFCDIYEAWTDSQPLCELNAPFYAELYLETEGPVVELGVGNGRIAVEAARRGRSLIGVDSSAAMLEQCRRRAREAGVAERLTLLKADMRAFELESPAALIAIPFHSIGHLLTPEDKLDGLRRAHAQLVPGGRLVFDHFVFDPELAARFQHSIQLRAEDENPATGRERMIWTTTQLDLDRQRMRIIVWTDELDDAGVVVERRYRRLSFSWIRPEEARELLGRAGFEVEAVHGGFAGEPFGPESREQVWFARRPS